MVKFYSEVDDSPIHAFAWAANISRLSSIFFNAICRSTCKACNLWTPKLLDDSIIESVLSSCTVSIVKVFKLESSLRQKHLSQEEVADLDVCYTAGIFPDLVQKHQKHCQEAALPRSMTVMKHAHTCATH